MSIPSFQTINKKAEVILPPFIGSVFLTSLIRRKDVTGIAISLLSQSVFLMGSALSMSKIQSLAPKVKTLVPESIQSYLKDTTISDKVSNWALGSLIGVTIVVSLIAGEKIAQIAGYNVSSSNFIDLLLAPSLFVVGLQYNVSIEPNNLTTITKSNFETEIKHSNLPVILDVYATWCPPCKKVAPLFAQLAEELKDKVKFVKMNIDEEDELAKKLDVQSMPTFLFFNKGEEKSRHIGILDEEGFKAHMKRVFDI